MIPGLNRRIELALTLPSLSWLLFFFLVPAILVFSLALRPTDLYGGIGDGWTLEHLWKLFSPGLFGLWMRTLGVSLLTTALCTLISLPIGYHLAKLPSGHRQRLLLWLVLPFWTSFIVRVFAWKFLLHPEGILKTALVAIGILSEADSLLYRQWTVIVVMVYTFLPVAILPIYSAASRFDFQLMEAGRDLGLSQFQAFVRVFVPGIRVGLFTATALVFIPVLGMYVIPDVIGGPQTEMLGNRVVQKVFVDRNLPEAAALSFLLLLMALVPLGLGYVITRRRAT